MRQQAHTAQIIQQPRPKIITPSDDLKPSDELKRTESRSTSLHEQERILAHFEPITLQEMESVKLMNRTDTKFIFNISHYPAVMNEITPRMRSRTRIGATTAEWRPSSRMMRLCSASRPAASSMASVTSEIISGFPLRTTPY